MHQAYSILGLVISIANPVVIEFHGSSVEGSWSMQGMFCGGPSSRIQGLSFMSLGSWAHVWQLHCASQGDRAKPQANFGR